MKARLITIYILSLLDLAFTLYLQARFGDIEANPFGKLLLSDTIFAVVYKVIVVGFALLWLYRCRDCPIAKAMSIVLLVAFSALTVYHTVIVSCVHYILHTSRALTCFNNAITMLYFVKRR